MIPALIKSSTDTLGGRRMAMRFAKNFTKGEYLTINAPRSASSLTPARLRPPDFADLPACARPTSPIDERASHW